jgi:hypothetical protein
VDCCPHKHTNSSQHQHLLNRGLSILHNSSKKMAQVQQNIFQLDVFKKLGALESSSRNPTLEEYKRQTIDMKINYGHIIECVKSDIDLPNTCIIHTTYLYKNQTMTTPRDFLLL